MKIAEGIAALELRGQIAIFPTLIWDNQNVILVDTGNPGQLGDIRDAMAREGVQFERLSKVIVTHQDVDHIGSLPDIVEALGGKVTVISHEIEKAYIQGDRPLIKSEPEQMKKIEQFLPEAARAPFVRRVQNPPKARVDIAVTDKEELPFCGGIVVIHSPGHTPGHISLYHKASRTLITGDSLTVQNGVLSELNPFYSSDVELGIQSLKKYLECPIDRVVTYHGGVVEGNVHDQICAVIGGR